MSRALPSLPRALGVALAGALALALVQQQLLARRPPRLLALEPQAHSSGPAALDLRFSRPMQRASLAEMSRLQPPLAHRWLGGDTQLRLLLQPGQVVRSPLSLELAGSDRRGLPLAAQRWNWDPRPLLLVVAEVTGGEQLQILKPDGRWQPLSAVLPRIPTLEPLADGSGVVFLASEGQGLHRLWKLTLRPRSLQRAPAATALPQPGALVPLWPERLSFAHASSNRRGDLLIQVGGQALGDGRTVWIDAGGRRRDLRMEVSGPILLLPEGEGMVVPTPDGLELRALDGQGSGAAGGMGNNGGESGGRPQILPGSRVLASFCPASGQALLVRHWPDYRRSLERVQPGAAPLTLWLGSEAVMAASCDQSGERAWMLLNRWDGGFAHELVQLDRTGRIVARRDLGSWAPEPGTPLSYDPAGDQLLLTLRPDPRQPARPVLVNGRTLELRILPHPVRQAVWLPAG